MTLSKVFCCVFVLIYSVALSTVRAVELVWDDDGGTSDKTWSNLANFNPNNLPDASDDLFIGVDSNGQGVGVAANDSTLLDGNFNIHSLTLGNGADVTNSDDGGTTTYRLGVGRNLPIFVRGGVTIGSNGGPSVLTLYRAPSVGQRSLQTDFLTINDGGLVRMISNGGESSLEVDDGFLFIGAGGKLSGTGTINLDDETVSPTKFFNHGTLTANTPSSLLSPPAAGTLQIRAASPQARFDWDGTGNGRIEVDGNQALDIDVRQANGFEGTMNLATGATLDVQHSWDLTSGQINVNTAAFDIVPIGQDPSPGSAARLAGASWSMQGGSIALGDSWDSLQFDSEFSATDGSINNQGHLIFNADATIGSAVNFAMSGDGSSLTVAPETTVTINDDDFDLDGNETSMNVVTVGNRGLLDLNLNTFDLGTDQLDGVINLNGGGLSVTVSDFSWTMDGTVNLNTPGLTAARLEGNSVTIGDDDSSQADSANVFVTGSGQSWLASSVTWNSDANVHVAAGASLFVRGESTFNSVRGTSTASFSGPGDIIFSGGDVLEETALNFSGGTVGLDGQESPTSALPAFDFVLDAPLTIHAAQLDEYGMTRANPQSTSELFINGHNGGRLDVLLEDPSGSWTANSVAVIHATNISLNPATFLTGSALQMNGTLNVIGANRSEAVLSIGGGVALADASSSLVLDGGSTLDNTPNRLMGGSISGIGRVQAGNTRALHGFGTISSGIEFQGQDSELMADDGLLLIDASATIHDLGILGTADSDGILQLASPWQTSVADRVELRGGELTGARITNNGVSGIRGEGLISARIINERRISAINGGTLIINNPANNNDLDGSSNSGSLTAINQSTLEIHNPPSAPFSGSVEVFDATVRAVNSGISFSSNSTLNLRNGGVYEVATTTSRLVEVNGTIRIGAGAPSRIELNDGFVSFANASVADLTGDLILDAPSKFIPAGATFNGGGSLINETGRLHLRDGASVDVLLVNQSVLSMGDTSGQTTGFEFEQTATGMWEVGVGGLGLNDFDRMLLTGAASLDGTLDLALLSNFVPTLGDTFTFLSANAGIFGTFDTVLQPASMPANLAFDVNYLGSTVQLEVIQLPGSFPADFDNDGDVDGDDLAKWQSDYGGIGSDADMDGDSDGFDFLAWQQQNGSGANQIATSTSAVPEPASLLLVGLAINGFALSSRRIHRR